MLNRFRRNLERKTEAQQDQIRGCLRQLREDPWHPGLMSRKMDGYDRKRSRKTGGTVTATSVVPSGRTFPDRESSGFPEPRIFHSPELVSPGWCVSPAADHRPGRRTLFF